MKNLIILVISCAILASCGTSTMETSKHIETAKSIALAKIGNEQVQQISVLQRGESVDLSVYFLDKAKNNIYLYKCSNSDCSFQIDNELGLMEHSSGLSGFIDYEDMIDRIEKNGVNTKNFESMQSYLVDNTNNFRNFESKNIWMIYLHSSDRMKSLDIYIDADSGEIISIANAGSGQI